MEEKTLDEILGEIRTELELANTMLDMLTKLGKTALALQEENKYSDNSLREQHIRLHTKTLKIVKKAHDLYNSHRPLVESYQEIDGLYLKLKEKEKEAEEIFKKVVHAESPGYNMH